MTSEMAAVPYQMCFTTSTHVVSRPFLALSKGLRALGPACGNVTRTRDEVGAVPGTIR